LTPEIAQITTERDEYRQIAREYEAIILQFQQGHPKAMTNLQQFANELEAAAMALRAAHTAKGEAMAHYQAMDEGLRDAEHALVNARRALTNYIEGIKDEGVTC